MSSTTIWLTIVGVAVTTAAIKSFGPVVMGGRPLPPRFAGVVVLTAPAVLAALVATSVFADGRHLAVGAATIGVGVAAVVSWRGKSPMVAVIVAASITALLRAAF